LNLCLSFRQLATRLWACWRDSDKNLATMPVGQLKLPPVLMLPLSLLSSKNSWVARAKIGSSTSRLREPMRPSFFRWCQQEWCTYHEWILQTLTTKHKLSQDREHVGWGTNSNAKTWFYICPKLTMQVTFVLTKIFKEYSQNEQINNCNFSIPASFWAKPVLECRPSLSSFHLSSCKLLQTVSLIQVWILKKASSQYSYFISYLRGEAEEGWHNSKLLAQIAQ
jgi:hypothetical protein